MALLYLHNKYLRVLEKIFSKFTLLTKFYINAQEKVVLEEFESLPMKDDAKVLFIGCGSIPNTLISLAKMKKWNLVGIDRDEKAVYNAKKILDMYGFKNVQIKHVDGRDVDLKDFDLIVVALGTEPKKDILERISANSKPGTYVLCRSTGSFSKIFGKERHQHRRIGSD